MVRVCLQEVLLLLSSEVIKGELFLILPVIFVNNSLNEWSYYYLRKIIIIINNNNNNNNHHTTLRGYLITHKETVYTYKTLRLIY